MNIQNLLRAFSLVALAVPAQAAPVPAPKITVESLFTEVIINEEDNLRAENWEIFGAQPLIQWPQGQPREKAMSLAAMADINYYVPVKALTEKPMLLTDHPASRAFFNGVPEAFFKNLPQGFFEELPSSSAEKAEDRPYIGFKYVFYPHSLLYLNPEPGSLKHPALEPLVFFLVKRAPDKLTEDDLEAAFPGEAAESQRVQTMDDGYLLFHTYLTCDAHGSPLLGTSALIESANSGFCQAEYRDGIRLLNLNKVEKQVAARGRFQAAADQGMGKAQYRVAEMLYDGHGGPADRLAARSYYQKAAEQGHMEAQYKWALMLAKGEEGPLDGAAARVLLQALREKSHQGAMSELARWLRKGIAGPADPVAALALYKTLADLGVPDAQYWLAHLRLDPTVGPVEPVAARIGFAALAGQGHLDATYRLALLLKNGVGGPADPAAARSHFRELTGKGDQDAKFQLALMLCTEPQAPDDLIEARGHFRDLVGIFDQATFHLAVMLNHAEGGPADPVAARGYFQELADQGHLEAQGQLALMLCDQVSTPPSA